MMEPVRGLVTFMSTLRRGEQPTVFARRGPCIVENFAPFIILRLGSGGELVGGDSARMPRRGAQEPGCDLRRKPMISSARAIAFISLCRRLGRA